MTKTLLIPDVHGDHAAVLRLMHAAGALNEHGERVPGFKVIQLGDLIDGTIRSAVDDRMALDLVEDGTIDIMLLGNHEYPFLGGEPFYGFEHDYGIRRRLLDLIAADRLRIAYAHGDTLITHAGLTPEFGFDYETRTAYDTAKWLNEHFLTDPLAPIFNQIGQARGGHRHATGGVLWSDWDEPRWLRDYNQIHGHTTAGIDKRGKDHFAMVLDNGGGKGQERLAGAILEGNSVKTLWSEPSWLTLRAENERLAS